MFLHWASKLFNQCLLLPARQPRHAMAGLHCMGVKAKWFPKWNKKLLTLYFMLYFTGVNISTWFSRLFPHSKKLFPNKVYKKMCSFSTTFVVLFKHTIHSVFSYKKWCKIETIFVPYFFALFIQICSLNFGLNADSVP